MSPAESADRMVLFGLVMACPFDQSNPPDCPLYEVRQMNLRHRLAWVSHLSVEEVSEWVRAHRQCLRRKEGRGYSTGEPRLDDSGAEVLDAGVAVGSSSIRTSERRAFADDLMK